MKIMETLHPIVENIPSELLKRNQWVVWRFEARKNQETKVPYSPVKGKRASCTDPATWGNFEQVQATLADGGYSGIGFVLTADDPFVGIDIDHALNDDDNIKPQAQEIIKLLDSYTEISPSGKGIHIILKGTKPDDKCKARYQDGVVEIYSQNRYFTVTGNSLDTPPKAIIDRQSQLEQVHKMIFGKEKIQQSPSKPLALKVANISAEELIKKISNSKNGDRFRKLWAGDWSDYPSQSEADLALCCEFAFWTGNDPGSIDKLFHQSGLMRPKWDRGAGRNLTYRQRTIQKAIENTNRIHSSNVFPQNQTNDKEEMKNSDTTPFPNVMGGFAGDFADLFSSYLEVPANFLYMSALTALGSILADRLTLESEIRPQPRLYTVLLGESADDRKSTAIVKTIEFFKSDNNDLAVCWGVGSAEGLQQRLKKNGKLLLCFDELRQFISKCRIEASVLLPCVNTLYENNHYESQTRTQGIVLDKVYLSILAASTVQTYERCWDSSFIDIGFNNRLFLVPGGAERRFSIPQKVPLSDKRILMTGLDEILEAVAQRGELSVNPEAKEIYHKWYINLESSIHSKRLDTYALRLMPLLAANELKKEVDVEIIKKVIALVDWQLEVRRQNDPVDAENTVARIEEKFRRVLISGPMTDRTLRQRTNAYRSGLWFFNLAKKNLTQEGEIVWDKKLAKWKLA